MISLQKDLTNEEKKLIKKEINLIDFSDTLDLKGAFLDSAAIINNLDLIISVDTSIAHLAGAFNKKVWIILKKFPDWRWLLNKRSSPWYPKARLFRQANYENWEEPIENIYKKIIEEFIDK